MRRVEARRLAAAARARSDTQLLIFFAATVEYPPLVVETSERISVLLRPCSGMHIYYGANHAATSYTVTYVRDSDTVRVQ